MKILLSCLISFMSLASLRAEITDSSYTSQTITIPGDRYTVFFEIYWTSADYPILSTPGRVELINSQNQLVGWAEGHVTNSGAVANTNLGTVNVLASSMTIMAFDLSVADGTFTGSWDITGVAPGTYTLRFWYFQTEPVIMMNTVWTQTIFQGGFAPPPPTFMLNTNAGPGGVVSPGGPQLADSWAIITATADGLHDFSGWTGDAGGSLNPLSLHMTATRTVQANFTLKSFVLTTIASSGGTVTPGGTYPYGTNVTLSAVPDGTHRFAGWVGAVTGSNPSVTLLMDAPKTVQAIFANKLNQSIDFPSLASLPPGGSAILSATATSGLPVSYTILSGPGQINGTTVVLNGTGPVVIEATQTGDGNYLPSPPVSQTIQAITVATVRYQTVPRTLLQGTNTAVNYLLNIQP